MITPSVASTVSNSRQKSREVKLRAVQRAMDVIEGFLNPFDIADKDRLYVISSGNPIPSEIEHDVLTTEEAGKLEEEKFVEERLKKQDDDEGRKEFFDPLKRLKLKTM